MSSCDRDGNLLLAKSHSTALGWGMSAVERELKTDQRG